ncbi:MAG TPA: HD-GYP domain-containing protein [Xanthomonadaceae bacterium]|nr:HD-GYP domain-containing protein [Xanthomonadaceae bacterium]
MEKIPSELRISASGLELGMFVSRLDRPWIETPFPLEGLKLKSQSEIEKLQRICSYVFVDTARGASPDVRFIEHNASDLIADAREQDEVAALRRAHWTIKSDFAEELKTAGVAKGALERGIEEVMADLQDGRHLDLKKLKEGVDAMVDSVVRNPSAFTWLKEMKRRDSYVYHHALGCSVWAASFGRHLGLEKSELQTLALGGLLCDVGKIRLPPELLTKKEILSDSEVALVRQHVEQGLEILAQVEGISPKIIEIVATHHERHDGSGYPRGLAGSDIPIYGRIMGLVDSYEAMTTIRPYALSRAPHRAVADLYEHRGNWYQAELVEQFIQTSGIYPIGTLVELTSGEVGVITAVHSLKRLRPSVMVLLDQDKMPLPKFRTLDLSLDEFDAEGHLVSVKGGLPAGAYNIDPQELFLD